MNVSEHSRRVAEATLDLNPEFAGRFVFVRVTASHERLFISVDHIQSLHAVDKMVQIRTLNGEEYFIYTTISMLTRKFPDLWRRLHRSWAVKPENVMKIQGNLAYMIDGSTAQISKPAMAAIRRYCFSNATHMDIPHSGISPAATPHYHAASARRADTTPKLYGADEGPPRP